MQIDLSTRGISRKLRPMDMPLPFRQFQQIQQMDVHLPLQYGYGYSSTDKIRHVVFVCLEASDMETILRVPHCLPYLCGQTAPDSCQSLISSALECAEHMLFIIIVGFPSMVLTCSIWEMPSGYVSHYPVTICDAHPSIHLDDLI